MTSSYDTSREFRSINIAILTVSDTRTSTTDKSGAFLSTAVVDAGHNVIHKRIVKDEIIDIKNVLESWSMSSDIDVIMNDLAQHYAPFIKEKYHQIVVDQKYTV